MVVPSAQINVFNGGQMTDLPEYTGAFDPTALIEVVSPGNEVEGINYAMSLATMAQFLIAIQAAPTIITAGATSGNHYVALPADYRILLNKTISSPSFVDIGAPAAHVTPIMVRDIKGDAIGNPITVSFSGTCDGLASPIVISAPYGGWTFNPLPNGNWYLTGI